MSQSYRDGGVEAESTMGHGFSNDSPAMSKQSASFGSLYRASQPLVDKQSEFWPDLQALKYRRVRRVLSKSDGQGIIPFFCSR